MALDIDSLLELELQHTEDTEQHMDLTPPDPGPATSNPADPGHPGPQNAPTRPPPHKRASWTHLSNALRRHHPTHKASKGPAEYRASLEHDLPDVTGPGLHGYTPGPPSPGAGTQEWEEEYAIDVTDMTAYVESVEDPEQDIILSLLAYHSWRWGHQVTPHRPQSGPHQWSPEQTAKWDIVLQLTPEGFYILTHSGLPNTTPTARALPLAKPQEDNAEAPPPEECSWDPPTATTEHMPHRLTKGHLPKDYHATSNSRGHRTLPLQWASSEGTFTWGEILLGAVALTYLWLRDAEAHTQAPGTHLLLTLEGEAAIENVHTAEGEDYVRANADTAVWLHAHEHTTPPTMVPGSHPGQVTIVHLRTGTDTGDAQQGWADRWAHVCVSLHDGLHRPSLTSHTLEPAPTMAESHTGAPPPTGVWAYTRTLHRAAAEALKTAMSNHQGLVHTPHDNTQKGYTLLWYHPAPEGGLQPPADQPGIGPDLTAVAHAAAAMAQQVGAPPQWAPSSSRKWRHATTQLSHTSGDAPFIHPYRTSTSLPTKRGPSTSSCPTTPRPKQGTRRHASPNSSPIPHSTTTYRRLNVIVTHNTGRDHYYLHATHERSPINIYTFTTHPGLQPPRHHLRPAWKHPLHVARTPRKRPAHHAPPPADSTALHAARRRAAAHHQNHLLPRISAGPGTLPEATHKSTLNLLARKLRPKMALEDTLWVYYDESCTAGLADLRTIIPRHIQRAVRPLTVYAVPHPITPQCTHCNPWCAQPCAGTLQQPLPTPTYRGGIYLGTIPGDPQPYLLPAADRHHAIPLHLVEHLAVGPSPFQKRPLHIPSDGRPPDEPTHAMPGPKRAIALLTLKVEATIPRDLEAENHLMVEGLTEHVLITAMYAAASASRLWEDRPSPALAQAAQDAPDAGPTAEDIHRILSTRAPPKTHPPVRPIQLVGRDAMHAPPATTEVHILKHRDIWWTVEWDDHGKVRRATAHTPDDEVPPPPRRLDRLQLAARVSHTPEAAWEALHYALYWAQGAPEGPLPPERTQAWTRHATRYTAHMRRHGTGTGYRLLTWPTDPPDTQWEAEEVLGLMTKQVFQLKDTVPTSKPDVPATREQPIFAPDHAPVQQPQGAPPQRGQPNARRRPGYEEAQGLAQAKPAPKPKAKPKSWTEEEAAALYPEYAIGTRVQLPFKYATAVGPSKWIWAAGEVKHRSASPGTTRGSRSTSSGTQPPPTTSRWGAPSNSGETGTALRWSASSSAPPTRSTSQAPSTQAKSTMHGPYPSPRSGAARQPQLRASSTSSTPDGAWAGHGPPPQLPVPRNWRLRKPTPASTSLRSPRSPTTPPPPPHYKPCLGHTLKAQTSWGSWRKLSAERTSPKRHRSWTWTETNTTPTPNEGCLSTTRRRSRCMPTPTSEWTVASARTGAWGPDGSSKCYSRTSHSGRRPRTSWTP